MPGEDLQPVVDQLKQANQDLVAKVAALEARTVVTDQQLADLKAAAAALASLGKS